MVTVMSAPGPQPFSDPAHERILSAADGYAELGLPDLAWLEVNALPEAEQSRPEVQELMLGLLVRQRRWEEAIETGRRLCTRRWERPAIYIHTAFALHETGRTAEARALLLAGPESLRTDPLYHYNMACYLAVSGDLKDAAISLKTAFRMDGKLRLHARHDPDLKDFHSAL
jgi:predicted Zn-dependent protease